MPYALFGRMNAHALRAEAAIRAGDRKTVEARVADMRSVRTQMQAWSKMLPPSSTKRWDMKEEALLVRGRASNKPSATELKSVTSALERYVASEDERPIAGPPFGEPPRETLANALLAAGKSKEALAIFERNLEQRPNRALALLGSARAAKASGETALSHTRYVALLNLWRDADPGLDMLSEVRDGAK